jgi:hypothetical protein
MPQLVPFHNINHLLLELLKLSHLFLFCSVIITILILILLTGFVDSLNIFLGRKPLKGDLSETYIAKQRRGSNDNRIVDLSFFNVGQSMENPDPDKPGKIIFDKNDPDGSLLPIIFPGAKCSMCDFRRNGISFKGISNSSFSSGSHASGTLECKDTNTYYINVKKPSDNLIKELESKGIYIFSGARFLETVEHNNRYDHYTKYTYIYADRKDAIGVFDPNDHTILPSSIIPSR